MVRHLFFIGLFFLLPLCLGEFWLRDYLWEYASYSNSDSIDQQLKEWKGRQKWDVVFIGDSEVRWGVNPIAFEEGVVSQGRQHISAFNHGFDGFGGSWWSVILPKIFKNRFDSKSIQYIAIGVQMIGNDTFWEEMASLEMSKNCGALQHPVLTSSFGIDFGLDEFCNSKSGKIDQIFNKFDFNLWFLRYRSAIKSIFLDETGKMLRFNSAKSGNGFRGFEPHNPIKNNLESFNSDFARWKKQFDGQPHSLSPLPLKIWEDMVNYGGYFDRMTDLVRSLGAEPIFFALPTNPLVIDYFHRRSDYIRNSDLLAKWAKSRGVIEINLGILDRQDPEYYFSDMRHLSYYGAEDFSKRLAISLVNHKFFSNRFGQ